MNLSTLIQLSPMLLMVTFLAYSGYSIHSSAVDPDAEPSALAKEVDSVVQELRAVGNSIANAPSGSLRDPFQIATKPVDAAALAEAKDAGPAEPVVDTLGDIVRGLRLEGTFVQGTEQIAIIDGRIYSRGQHLVINADPSKLTSKLFLVGVQPSQAILHADGRNFVLGYSDQIGSALDKPKSAVTESSESALAAIDPGGQLALLQRLLNLPFGAAGKSTPGRGRASRSRRAGAAATSTTRATAN